MLRRWLINPPQLHISNPGQRPVFRIGEIRHGSVSQCNLSNKDRCRRRHAAGASEERGGPV